MTSAILACILSGSSAFDDVRRPSQAPHEQVELLGRYARQDGWVGNLVSIQMQNGKHGAIAHRVEKFVGVPTGGQRSCLRFSISDRYRNDQVGIVERGSEAMGEAVAEFAAFMNRPRGFRSAMAPDASRE